MTTVVHFAYRCSHVLDLQDDLVPTWILKEYFGSVDYDPNTWQDVTHDYGTITVDDDCSACKEKAARRRQREASKHKGAATDSASTPPPTVPEERNSTGSK